MSIHGLPDDILAEARSDIAGMNAMIDKLSVILTTESTLALEQKIAVLTQELRGNVHPDRMPLAAAVAIARLAGLEMPKE